MRRRRRLEAPDRDEVDRPVAGVHVERVLLTGPVGLFALDALARDAGLGGVPLAFQADRQLVDGGVVHTGENAHGAVVETTVPPVRVTRSVDTIVRVALTMLVAEADFGEEGEAAPNLCECVSERAGFGFGVLSFELAGERLDNFEGAADREGIEVGQGVFSVQ